MCFGCLAGFLEGASGVLKRLARKLMGSQAALAMRCGRSSMGMRGKIVKFSGSVVNALGHVKFSCSVRCQSALFGVTA